MPASGRSWEVPTCSGTCGEKTVGISLADVSRLLDLAANKTGLLGDKANGDGQLGDKTKGDMLLERCSSFAESIRDFTVSGEPSSEGPWLLACLAEIGAGLAKRAGSLDSFA
jgi:hypothetical protein